MHTYMQWQFGDELRHDVVARDSYDRRGPICHVTGLHHAAPRDASKPPRTPLASWFRVFPLAA